jgi:hypothetical protein
MQIEMNELRNQIRNVNIVSDDEKDAVTGNEISIVYVTYKKAIIKAGRNRTFKKTFVNNKEQLDEKDIEILKRNNINEYFLNRYRSKEILMEIVKYSLGH